MPPDRRTDEEYLAEVERYLASCRAYYTQLALSRYAASDAALMRLRLANASDRNYTDIQVQIHIAGKVSARGPDEIDSPGEEPPAAPSPRGARQPVRLFPRPLPYAPPFRQAPRPLRTNFRISNSDSATITYDISWVRPEQRIDLLPVLLSLTGDGESRLGVTWTVATGNADGLARGTFEVTIGAPVDAVELLPELAT
jgi:hypothetical protein